VTGVQTCALPIYRAIKACLRSEQYSPGKWEDTGIHCSQTERRADDATRDVVAWLKCYFMQDRLGEEFEGVIASVVSFGIFVALDDIYVEGLVHVSDLGQDYYHFDAARHQMLGERTGKRYRLGDRVRVKVARVDLDSAKIDFVLAEDAPIRRVPAFAAPPAKPVAANKPAAKKPADAKRPASKAKPGANPAAKPAAKGKKGKH
jgi:ribonuclease R